MVSKIILSIIFTLAVFNISNGFEISFSSNYQTDNVSMSLNKNSFGLTKNVHNNFTVSGKIAAIPYSIGDRYIGVREVSGFYSQADLSGLYQIGNFYLGAGVSGNDLLGGSENFSIGFSAVVAYGLVFNEEQSVFVIKPYFSRGRVVSTPMSIEYNVISTKPGVNMEFRHAERVRFEVDFSVEDIEVDTEEFLLEDTLRRYGYEEGNTITSFYTRFQVLRVLDILNFGASFVHSNSENTFNQIVHQQLVSSGDGAFQLGSSGNQVVVNGVVYHYAYIPIYTPNNNMSLNFHISSEPLWGLTLSAKIPLWSRYIWQAREFPGVSEEITNTAEIELRANYERDITDIIAVGISGRVVNKPYSSFGYFSRNSYTSLLAGLSLRMQF